MNIRILVDAHVFDDGFQGTRTFLKGIYNHMLDLPGLEIYFAAGNTEQLAAEFPHPSARFIPLKSRSGWQRLLQEFPQLIKKYRFHYAHFQYMVPPLKYCRYIVTTHDVIFNEFPEEFSVSYRLKKNFLYRRAVRQSDILTTVSAYSARSIRRFLGNPHVPVHIIPNGVSPVYFEACNRERAKDDVKRKFGIENYILYVSRIEPRKNQLLLLQTFIKLGLAEKGYQLLLVGHPTLPVPGLQELIRSSAGVHHISRVAGEDLLQLYRGAGFFVYPSLAEGFGIPPLEAAAAGIPVLCSGASAMQEFSFFQPWLVDVNDEEHFRRQLASFLASAHDKAHLEQVADQIREKYSWERSAASLYEIIISHYNHQKKLQHDKIGSA